MSSIILLAILATCALGLYLGYQEHKKRQAMLNAITEESLKAVKALQDFHEMLTKKG